MHTLSHGLVNLLPSVVTRAWHVKTELIDLVLTIRGLKGSGASLSQNTVVFRGCVASAILTWAQPTVNVGTIGESFDT